MRRKTHERIMTLGAILVAHRFSTAWPAAGAGAGAGAAKELAMLASAVKAVKAVLILLTSSYAEETRTRGAL